MASREPFNPNREDQLRHHAEAVNDMIRQLKYAVQNPSPVRTSGKNNRGSFNKKQPQRYRGQRGRNQSQHKSQRFYNNEWEEFEDERSHCSWENFPSPGKYSYHQEGSVVTPQHLVNSLAEFSDFSASLLQLMERKNFSPSVVRYVVSRHQQLFLLDREKVTLKPKITLCVDYLSSEGCVNQSKCKNFHICPNFITGKCKDQNCFIGHSWHTNHNRSLLKPLCIEQLSVPQLHDLFQSLGSNVVSPDSLNVCIQYNEGGCQESDCKALHVCHSFVVGITKCHLVNCQLNHNILNPSCNHLLSACGFSTNEAPRDVIIALLAANPSLSEKAQAARQQDGCSHRSSKEPVNSTGNVEKTAHSHSKKSRKEEVYALENENESDEGHGDKNNQSSDGNEDEDSSEDVEIDTRDSPMKANNSKKLEHENESNTVKTSEDGKNISSKNVYQQTLWSHYPQGNVLIPEICYDAVESMCQLEAIGCPRLHATQHFHWQVSEQGNCWFNLRSAQLLCLELAYCDVAKDSVDLPRLDPSTVEYSVSGLLILMGRDTWHADFTTMNLTNSNDTKKLLIRRLCTELKEGQIIKASSFVWSFLDKNQKWVTYGSVDTAGESTFVSSATSDDIEKHFVQNPSSPAPLTFKNAQFSYILDFNTMMQTNQSTRVSRQIRRRPERHLEESAKAAQKQKDSEFPETWDVMQPEERMLMVDLASSSNEYQTVLNLLGGKLPSSSVTKIERVQNPFLWRAFQNKVKEMTAIYRDASKVDVRQLFHGTAHDVVPSICSENFDWRLHGSSSGQMYGRGTYFSIDAKYAYNYCRANAAGMKYMFVVRVAVGAITAGNASMVRPPNNPITNAPFDSSVDNVSNFTILVKYDKQEYYPEYILTLT